MVESQLEIKSMDVHVIVHDQIIMKETIVQLRNHALMDQRIQIKLTNHVKTMEFQLVI